MTQEPQILTLELANQLVELPLACVNKEYPHKLQHVATGKNLLKEPHELYPAFCGCFDWHSAVHGHWSLVRLLKKFPELEKADVLKSTLLKNISKLNMAMETRFFEDETNLTFERTYGWAWLLKLSEEIHLWNNPLAKALNQNLQPLTTLITRRFIEYLPNLIYPIRSGEHTNTAFALSLALDFANSTQHKKLREVVHHTAKSFYLNGKNCPIDWEPAGHDFLSPCLQEIDLMRKVLSRKAFLDWISDFLPQIKNSNFKLEIAKVKHRNDGKLVHLDGLNFSRAWVLFGLARQYPEFNHLISIANQHVKQSLPNLFNDSYEGSHWLGTFAIFALDS